MSVSLFLIANIKTPIASFEEVAIKLLLKLNSIQWHNSKYSYTYDKKGNSIRSLRDKKQDTWQIVAPYDDEIPYLEFESDNYEISNIILYENVCVMIVLDHYQDIYNKHKDFNEFQKFRKNLFEILTFLNGSEVIFLPDSSYKSSTYLDLPNENKSYQNIKDLMVKAMPKMQTNYFDLSYTNDIENEFFLDNFNDFKKKKAYSIKEVSIVLGYVKKEPIKYKNSFEEEFMKQEFHNSYLSKHKIKCFSNLIENLKSKNKQYLEEFKIFRKKVKSENTNIVYALYIFEQELSKIDIHYYITDDLDVAKERFRNTVQLNLSNYLLGKVEFNTEYEVLVIYDDFRDLEV